MAGAAEASGSRLRGPGSGEILDAVDLAFDDEAGDGPHRDQKKGKILEIGCHTGPPTYRCHDLGQNLREKQD